MGFFGRIFGSDSVIDGAINGIDKVWFTDEEKSDYHLKMLASYEPFKVAQRGLGFIFAGLFGLAFVMGLVFVYLDESIKPILELVESFDLSMIMGLIIVFYFGGGTINSLKGK